MKKLTRRYGKLSADEAAVSIIRALNEVTDAYICGYYRKCGLP